MLQNHVNAAVNNANQKSTKLQTRNWRLGIMRTALIGYTGFVGSNLCEQGTWTNLYNSKNIGEMRGEFFDQVVCAGVSAVKWWANKNPEEDWKNIGSLLNVLRTVRAGKFVLISTIDVYPNPVQVDERSDCESTTNHAYGTHRLKLEKELGELFSDLHVMRLPGLFGRGLKKNVIYDFLNSNCLDAINPESVIQYYYLDNFSKDMQRAST